MTMLLFGDVLMSISFSDTRTTNECLHIRRVENVHDAVSPEPLGVPAVMYPAALCVLELHLVAADNSSENGGVIPSGHATGSLRGIALGDESAAAIGAKSIAKAFGCAPAATCRVVADKQPVAGGFLHLDGSVKVQCALLDSVKLP